jgi:hypothetical protein
VRRVAFVLAVLLMAGCSGEPRPPAPKYGNEAIKEVANRLNQALQASDTLVRPVLPDEYREMDFYNFTTGYQFAFAQLWVTMLNRQGLDVEWPGDLRLLTRGKGDSPTEFPTNCSFSNFAQPKVTPASKSIFYCAKDPMRVPGPVHYPQGTLWVPIDALMAQWRAAKIVGPSAATKGQQIAQAAFVYLTAAWGDALTRQIRAYAGGRWNLHVPVMERADVALVFGYCVAGAMGWATYGEGDSTVIPLAVTITLGSQVQTGGGASADPLIKEYTTALVHGFTNHSIGSCVDKHWVRENAPAV